MDPPFGALVELLADVLKRLWADIHRLQVQLMPTPFFNFFFGKSRRCFGFQVDDIYHITHTRAQKGDSDIPECWDSGGMGTCLRKKELVEMMCSRTIA